jgi:hypothetical protein
MVENDHEGKGSHTASHFTAQMRNVPLVFGDASLCDHLCAREQVTEKEYIKREVGGYTDLLDIMILSI